MPAGASGGFADYSLPFDAQTMSAGSTHTCAINTVIGALPLLTCWGDNSSGQIDGFPSPSSAVGRPPALEGRNVAFVRAGTLNTCILVDGSVMCWGSNEFGQSDPLSVARNVGPSIIASTLATGFGRAAGNVVSGLRHACARYFDGHIDCWGALLDADGRFTRVSAPQRVDGIDDVREIAAGGMQTCAVSGSRGVLCWGANDSGQLGDGTTTASATPVAVLDAPVAYYIATNGSIADDGRAVGHTCLIEREHGGAWCWGENGRGELGIGVAPDSPAPTRVLAREGDEEEHLVGVGGLRPGLHHTCATTYRGAVLCWGDNSLGQLDGSIPPTTPPFGRAIVVPGFGPREAE